MVQAVADLLGMTPDQIRAERQGGKSLAAIAAERGVDQTTLVQTITNAMVPRIQQFVGRMVNREGSGRPEGLGPREGRDARGFRGGPRDGQGGPGQGLFQPIADLLGMTPDQVVAERRAGKSLADIAAARGVDQATLVQAITVTARARLDEQVAAGRLTRRAGGRALSAHPAGSATDRHQHRGAHASAGAARGGPIAPTARAAGPVARVAAAAGLAHRTAHRRSSSSTPPRRGGEATDRGAALVPSSPRARDGAGWPSTPEEVLPNAAREVERLPLPHESGDAGMWALPA